MIAFNNDWKSISKRKPTVNSKKFITIDPGINTAVVCWYVDNIEKPTFFEGSCKLFFCSTITGVVSWEEKADIVLHNVRLFFYDVFSANNPEPVYCEKPEFWLSQKGLTSATNDALFKLIAIYGRIWQVAKELDLPFYPLSPREWKGNLSKKQTQQRVKKIMGSKSNFSEHEYDALGMGLYLLGIF